MSRLFLDVTPLRQSPPFRRLWSGFGLRQIGQEFVATTVIYQVYVITHSNLDLGLVSLAQLVPGILGPLIGGPIADAYDRRRILGFTAVLIALCSVGLAMNARGPHPLLWPIFVLSAANAGFVGLELPSRTSALVTLVEREALVASAVLRGLLDQISSIGGPALAGVLIGIFTHDLSVVYWIDVAGTIGAIQAVLRLPPLLPKGGGRKFGLDSFTEGFRFLRGRQAIQACFIGDLEAMVLGMPITLFPFMAFVHFHGGTKTLGLLLAAPAIGALIGGLVSGWTRQVRRMGRAVVVAIVVWGLAIALFGLAPWLSLGIAALVIAGWADAISATFRGTILQLEVPDRLRGRLTAVHTAVVLGGPRLGNTEAGIVASLTNAQLSIVSGGLGCVAGILAVARFMPSLLKHDSATAMDPDETPAEISPR